MQKLSEREYWDSVYLAKTTAADSASTSRPGCRLKSIIKKSLGPFARLFFVNYASFQLWDRFFLEYLPQGRTGLKTIEIGSAPGTFMVNVRNRLGYEVYGIEYSEEGAAINRKIFAAKGIDPSRVLQSDFFDPQFHSEYAGFFDGVFSLGFIEHFDDVKNVCDLHINLVKPGGFLVIMIPRFRKLNGALMAFFYKENLSIHNLHIMERDEFIRLFDDDRLESQYCGYCGTFNLGLFNTKPTSPKRYILKCCRYVQMCLNCFFHVVFRHRGFDNSITSPYLLYIGVKKA